MTAGPRTTNNLSAWLRDLPNRIFRLRYTYANPLDQQQAFGVLVMSWGTLISMFLAALYQLSDPAQVGHRMTFANITFDVVGASYLGVYALAILILGLCIVLVNRGNLALARSALVLAFFVYSFLFYLFTGLTSFMLFAFSLPLVAAGVLLSRRGVLVVIGILAGLLLLIGVFAQIDLLVFSLTRPPTLGEALSTSLFVLVLAGTMLALFAGGQRLLLQRNLILTEELSGLTAVSKIANSAVNVQDALTRLVDLVRDQLGYYHAQIFLIEEKTQVVSLIAGTGLALDARRRFGSDAVNIINETIQAGYTRRISLSDSPAMREEFLPATAVELLIPLRHGGEVMGLLDVQSVQRDAFTAQDIDALEALAAQMATAIANTRLSDALRAAQRTRDELQEEARALRYEKQRLDQELSGRA
jgi:GAF domain-containing protein